LYKELIEQINNLSNSQVSKAIELLIPRLAKRYENSISKETTQLVEAPDLNKASYLLAESLKEHKCSMEEATIREAVENEESRIEVSKRMLIILASTPETTELVNSVVTSAKEQMFADQILAIGVSATMILLGSSVVISICRMKPKDLPSAVKDICGAITAGFTKIGEKLLKKDEESETEEKPSEEDADAKEEKKPTASEAEKKTQTTKKKVKKESPSK
jgi:hypothetical protein